MARVKHASGLNNSRRDTERWLEPIQPHLQHLAAASSASTSLEATLLHITVTLATWDVVWEVHLDPEWTRQRLRLYGAQDRALEQFFKVRHLAAASSASTSLEANLLHITVTLATWDVVWEVHLDPEWDRQRLRLYGAQNRALEQFFKLEEENADLSMKRHGRAKQLPLAQLPLALGEAGVLMQCCEPAASFFLCFHSPQAAITFATQL
ncbi:uncharacterized protein HaLaN_07332 [Haematococcus lacustris]|uniref:Uncharacterized protein n=1 Tax=Haematococcus lacustris TaxID=44745 RepID=A0A699YXN8_HAELA|nr:uncharacterized protein HaLaN_07332 [Haematococcus lacustris]